MTDFDIDAAPIGTWVVDEGISAGKRWRFGVILQHPDYNLPMVLWRRGARQGSRGANDWIFMAAGCARELTDQRKIRFLKLEYMKWLIAGGENGV